MLGRLIRKLTGQPPAAAKPAASGSLGSAPDDIALGERLFAAGNLPEAEACFARALRDSPTDARAHNGLGVIRLAAGRNEEAREYFRRALEAQPDFAFAYSNMSVVEARLGSFESAANYARRALSIDPGLDEAQITLAESLVICGDYDEAQSHFHAAAAAHRKWRIAGAIRFDRDFWESLRDEPVDATPLDIRLDVPPDRIAGQVLLVSCDPRYCRLFLGPLIESLDVAEHPPPVVHLHVVGDESGLIERIGHFRSRYPGIRLVVSTESEPAGLDDAQRLVYYACARFLVLRRLAERYRCPIFVLDIDAVFRGGLADVARAAQGADLGLYLRRPQRIVWTNVAAGRFLVNPTLAADAYLLMVEAYIRRALRNRRMDWFLDQVALYCCLILMRRFEQAPTVYELNDDLDRAMYAFPARFSEKLDDPLYTQYFVQF